jgi:hypothetical protein
MLLNLSNYINQLNQNGAVPTCTDKSNYYLILFEKGIVLLTLDQKSSGSRPDGAAGLWMMENVRWKMEHSEDRPYQSNK